MNLDDNKVTVRRMLEWWAGGDVSVLDETVADDYVAHQPGGNVIEGREAIKARRAGHIRMFSDRTLTVDDIVAEGDRVAVRYSWSGVTSNGRPVNMRNVAIYRLSSGKIAEEWEECDTASLREQFGG